VPANTGNQAYQGYDPTKPTPDTVGNGNAPNSQFGTGPANQSALHFQVTIPNDNRPGLGQIIFFQDCEWDAVSPSSASAWSSWGFVTNFALQLIEPGAQTSDSSAGTQTSTQTSLQTSALLTGTASSSSSSYYAASSSMPGR